MNLLHFTSVSIPAPRIEQEIFHSNSHSLDLQIPCLTSAIAAAGCAPADESCQCGTMQSAIQTAVTPCLLSACNQSDLLLAASVGLALCSSYEASISATHSASTTPVAASASTTTASQPTSTTSVVAETTSVPVTSAPSRTASSTDSSASAVSTGGAPAVVLGMGGVIGALVGIAAVL